MNTARLDEIVRAVLYEGYTLYPYRASSTKNQRERFTFGRVYPRRYSTAQGGAEPDWMQTECLAQTRSTAPSVGVVVRFLQVVSREVGVLDRPLLNWQEGMKPACQIVPELRVAGALFQTWQEAREREITIPPVSLSAAGVTEAAFAFEPSCALEPIGDEQERVVAVLRRRSQPIAGRVEVRVEVLPSELRKVTIRITNLSPMAEQELDDPDAVMERTFASTHTILQATEADFVSLMDPGAELKEAANSCRNVGTWPVLVGNAEQGERDLMLSSPIILYDYPQVAPESRGDLFDATEIDEILTLRIQTMTESEKDEMRHLDALTRRLLERAEALPRGDLIGMHGTFRDGRSGRNGL